ATSPTALFVRESRAKARVRVPSARRAEIRSVSAPADVSRGLIPGKELVRTGRERKVGTMPAYSLDLNGLDGMVYVPSAEFPEAVHPGAPFPLNGSPGRVTDVATKQFDAHDQPKETLRCILA